MKRKSDQSVECSTPPTKGGATPAAAVEIIGPVDSPIAYIIRAELLPDATQFVTPPTLTQQVGFIRYPAGGVIARHKHRPLDRRIVGTPEVLVVRKGRCEVELFDERDAMTARRELGRGDVLVLVRGGHGFKMLEDTVLLEIKQGPYTGLDEKEHF